MSCSKENGETNVGAKKIRSAPNDNSTSAGEVDLLAASNTIA